MAGFTFTSVADRFPAATSVGAYLASQRRSGAPEGAAVTTASVASDGSLAFTGLTYGVAYVAYAQVGGVHRYVSFTAPTGSVAVNRIWLGNGLVSAAGGQAIGTNGQSAASTGGGPKSIPFDPADYPGVRRLRFKCYVQTNATAPNTTVLVELQHVTNTNGSVSTSVGAVVDATAVASLDFGTISAVTADADWPLKREQVFNAPTGLTLYLCRVTIGASPATNSALGVIASLAIVPDWY